MPPERSLTEQLLELEADLQPTSSQIAQKDWVTTTLQPLLEKHSGGRLSMFGSCENGFWMNGSDVDACLIIRRCTQKQSWVTKLNLVKCLVQSHRLGTAEVVAKARVPVAKVNTSDGMELCDISVNNVAALENSCFVRTFAQLDPRVPSLGRFIKHWASRRRINNRSEGTLSTYTLMLQLFYFLQTRGVPVLPRVSDLLTEDCSAARDALLAQASAAPSAASTGSSASSGGGGGVGGGIGAGAAGGSSFARALNAFARGPELDNDTGELRPLPFLSGFEDIVARTPGLVGRNTESLGDLLHGYFELWGREEFAGGRTVYVYDAEREENELGVLVMRCPLTHNNVNPFTPSVWRAIHSEYGRAAYLLRNGRRFAELCQAAEESPAGRGPRMGR